MSQNPTLIFIHYLQQLGKMLTKIEAAENSTAIFTQSLHADMLPFIAQVRTAINFSLRACCPLAKLPVVAFNNDDESFAGLQQQIATTIHYLRTIPARQLVPIQSDACREKAGFNNLELPPEEFLYQYALPNFFFHLSMVYALARSRGIALSKGDFDGYHQYPIGFSFVEHRDK